MPNKYAEWVKMNIEHMCITDKVVLRGKFITLYAYIRKEERSQLITKFLSQKTRRYREKKKKNVNQQTNGNNKKQK